MSIHFFITLLVSVSCVYGNRTLSSNFFPKLSIETETSSPTVLAPLLVSTRFGLLRGMSLKTSKRHKTVSAFLGVPFARPPGQIHLNYPVDIGNAMLSICLQCNFRNAMFAIQLPSDVFDTMQLQVNVCNVMQLQCIVSDSILM